MPFDVSLDGLDAAVGDALAAGERSEVREAAGELSRLADDNVRAIVERVRLLVARGDDTERQQLVERRQGRYRAIAAGQETCDVATENVRDELFQARRESGPHVPRSSGWKPRSKPWWLAVRSSAGARWRCR